MTRITLWILSTLSVLVLLFGYHTSTVGATDATPPAAYSGSLAGTTAGSTGSTGSTADPADPAAPADPADPASGGTFTGDSTDTRWGPVQVAVTVADGTITDVQVPVYPTGNSRDDEINSYALPILIRSTLDAQSSEIDMVSGATVTSVGYRDSLQSALDQAGL